MPPRAAPAAIGLNPLHALFPDRADDASPYAPNSRLYLNPLYIDVEAIAEFPGVAAAGLQDGACGACARRDMIDYAGVARAKLAGLHLAYERFRAAAERRAARRLSSPFAKQQGDTLLRFACFEVLAPAIRARAVAAMAGALASSRARRPAGVPRNAHDEACEFHEFVQWVADRQLARLPGDGAPAWACRSGSISISPSASIRHGADAWIQQGAMLADVSIGAPPDEFNPSGQDWGLAPFNPQALPADDFAAMRRLMARHHAPCRRHPARPRARPQAPVHDPARPAATAAPMCAMPFEQLLRVIAEESNRFRTIVIGEDLGTVPEHFRETLAHWGLWGCRVMLFERDHEGRFLPPERYPAEALATFNTHDMASFRGWMEGHDMRVKRAIGFEPGESDEQRAHARAAVARRACAMRRRLMRRTTSRRSPRFLGATPSRLVVIALDDILGEREQINIPGTVHQHPNWRRKLPVAIEDLNAHDGLAPRGGSVRARRAEFQRQTRSADRHVPDVARVFAHGAVGGEPAHARGVDDGSCATSRPAIATAGRRRAAPPNRPRNRPPP